MTQNKTSEAANKILRYIEDNDVVTWHNLADKHLREILLTYRKLEEAVTLAKEFIEDPDAHLEVHTMTLEYRPPLTAEQRMEKELERIRRLKKAAAAIREALASDPLAE